MHARGSEPCALRQNDHQQGRQAGPSWHVKTKEYNRHEGRRIGPCERFNRDLSSLIDLALTFWHQDSSA